MQLPHRLAPGSVIWRISFRQGISEQARTELLSRIPIREGALVSDELVQQTLRAVKEFDARLDVMVNQAPPPEAYEKMPQELRERLPWPPAQPAVNVTIYDPARMVQRIRIEAGQQSAMLLDNPTPVWPALAEAAGQVVRLTVIVAKDGMVSDVRPIDGPEALVAPAAEAVRQWRYRPTLLNGIPVEVQTTVELAAS